MHTCTPPQHTHTLPTHLPLSETGRAQEVSTGLQTDVLVILGADLAQLEGGAHLAVQLVLLLRYADVVLLAVPHQETQVRVHVATVRKQKAEHSRRRL